MGYIRQDQADIDVTVDGEVYNPGIGASGSWYSASGGNLESDDSKTRPGGMGREVALGGPSSREDLVVSTQLTDLTVPWLSKLEAKVGNGRVNVTIAYLGNDRKPAGGSLTYTGILKGISRPDFDSGASEATMLELTVSLDEISAS